MTSVSDPPTAMLLTEPTSVVASEVVRLQATFESGRTRSLKWRLGQLAAVETMMRERESDIAEALAADLGRPALDSWLGDVASVQAEAVYARKHLRRWMRAKRTGLPLTMQPGKAYIRYEPLGIVLVIGPWNYPIYLSLGPIVGALAAGNCAVVKPSEHAPASSALLADLVPRYLDADAIAVIEGDASTTQQLIDQRLDHIFFTGGPEIGKLVMAAAAPHLTPVTLELGGKSPAIVTAGANLDVAARRIAWTKFLNSGQTCVAPDYVLAESSIADALVDKISAAIDTMHGTDASLPIVNQRQFDRLGALIDGAGGQVVRGGARDASTCAIEPTVILDPDPHSALMHEEIFGPVLPVVRVPSFDDALTFVKKRPKPLAAYLFSSRKNERRRLVNEVSSGGSVVNQAAVQVLVPHLPFGGVGNSGMGTYHGQWGFQTFSHRKSVLERPARPDLSLMYPPYSPRTEKLIRRFF